MCSKTRMYPCWGASMKSGSCLCWSEAGWIQQLHVGVWADQTEPVPPHGVCSFLSEHILLLDPRLLCNLRTTNNTFIQHQDPAVSLILHISVMLLLVAKSGSLNPFQTIHCHLMLMQEKLIRFLLLIKSSVCFYTNMSTFERSSCFFTSHFLPL